MRPRLRREHEAIAARGLGESLTHALVWPVLVVSATLLGIVACWVCTLAGATPVSNGDMVQRDATAHQPVLALRLSARAPVTVAGYRAMFAKVPRAQWGAADLTISSRLPDGRRVWLFGDTISENKHGYLRFVHSTAMVQAGGVLKVSRKGAQVLPNVSKSKVYWIETVRTVGSNRVRITAALMNVTAGDPWGFSRARVQSHEADLVVTPKGDVRFAGWRRWVPEPYTGDGEDLVQVGAHHFTYGAFVHGIKLHDGRWLRTVNQNWDDDLRNHMKRGQVRFSDYRPLFGESTTRSAPYLGR